MIYGATETWLQPWSSVWQYTVLPVQPQTFPDAGLLHCSLKILHTLATF